MSAVADHSIPRRTLRASAALLWRQVAIHGLSALTGVLLARWLTPSEFGVYAVVAFTLALLTVLGDVGLGAGLVREPDEPGLDDYRTALGLQHALTVTLAVATWLAAPSLARLYHLDERGVAMFRLLAVTLPFTALQAVSSIRMERTLSFGRLSALEVVQSLVYNLTVLALVWRGFGIVSFGVAWLARAMVGAAAAWALAPWPIGWRIDPARVRVLLHFGLPYQGIGAVSLLKESLTPVLVATVLGTAAVGYVNWAQLVAAYPVLGMMALQRVYLPSFARLQHRPEALARLVENVLRMTNAVVAPLAMVTLVLAAPATPLVFGAQWLPALPLFYLLWAANLVVATATPLMGLLNALGMSRHALGFATLWMAMTWALGVPLVLRMGFVGFGVANLIVQLSAFWLFRVAQRRVRFRIGPAVAAPWLVAAVAAAVVWGAARLWPPRDLAGLIVLGALGLLLYVLGMAVVWRSRLRRVVDAVRGAATDEDALAAG